MHGLSCIGSVSCMRIFAKPKMKHIVSDRVRGKNIMHESCFPGGVEVEQRNDNMVAFCSVLGHEIDILTRAKSRILSTEIVYSC